MSSSVEEWENIPVGRGDQHCESVRVADDLDAPQSTFPDDLDGPGDARTANKTGCSAQTQQQQQQQQQHPERLAAAKFWDRQIASGNLSMLPEVNLMHVNICAWGESGLGKTTFIKNLVQGWGLAFEGEAFQTGGRTSSEQFRRDPASMRLQTQPIIDKGANRGLVITIQDMPGWGDEINLVSSLKAVVSFLLEQRKKDLLDNKAGVTEAHPCPGTIMKHGMTVCLYFLPPQRAKDMDWFMLEGISSLVAVVPVIAKADTHTAPELEAYRREVLQVIERASNQAAAAGGSGAAPATPLSSSAPSLTSTFRTYSFSPDNLAAVQALDPLMPPFAIMGSQVLLGPEESALGPAGAPCRRYLWGTALPLEREHSDLIILKQLLAGHQNRAVYGLLGDSWSRAFAFNKSYALLRRAQLESRIAAGEVAASAVEILSAVEGLDVDLSPLVSSVCTRVSSFGDGPIENRLRCEEQHMLEHRLSQALVELQETKKRAGQRRASLALAFLFGALLALAVAGVYLLAWGSWAEAPGVCDSVAGGVGNATCDSTGSQQPPHAAVPPVGRAPGPQDCYWKRVYRPGNVVERMRFCASE